MKLSTIFWMLMAVSLWLMACNDTGKTAETKKEENLDAMAKELCTCMTPLSDLYQEVVAASEIQDTVKIQSLIGKFEQLSQEGEACAAQLEAKYGDMDDPAIEEKAKAAVRKHCPDIAAMMENSGQ